jgi:hypothetical protein
MGLARELQEIWSSDQASGLERYTALALRASMFLSLGYWVTRLFSGPKTYIAIELYVLLRLAVLTVLLINSAEITVCYVMIASYCGVELYAYLLNIVFTSKYRQSPVKVKSVERSLLLFFLNAAEINVWFGILYCFIMQKNSAEGLHTALLVFGTLGAPQLDPKPEFLDMIVTLQIALDFVFVVILAGAIVGKLRAFEDH